MTDQKCLEVQPHEASNLSTTRSHLLAMSTMHTTPAPPLPVRIPPKGSILSPEWTHAITTIMSHPLSSETGNFIQNWILYHAIPYPFDFWLNWDPTDPYDNKLLRHTLVHWKMDFTDLTAVLHMTHFWVVFGRCIMPGSPMGRSEGSSRRWTGKVLSARNTKKNPPLHASRTLMVVLPCLDHP